MTKISFMVNIDSNNKKDPIENGLWYIFGLMIFIGVAMVFCFAAGINYSFAGFLTNASLGLLMGGAFFTAGGLAGFLFGIPKLLQNSALIPDTKSNKPVIVHNDNLVQISDWLTKIIVGVGLTQLYNLPHFILRVGEKLQNSFGTGYYGRDASIAIILYFVVIGFLCVYIWTRIYFVRLLKDLDDELDPINILNQKINENAEEQERKLKLTVLSSKIDQFEKLRDKIINAENNFDGLKDIFKVYKPGPIKMLDDSQKGRWGGKSEVNGINLEADIKESEDLTTDNHTIYTITLNVKGTSDHPLEGKVYFFLHESYLPMNIMIKEAKNNIASIQIESYEAFTVGAVCESGNTVLELDLNEYPGSPKDYKYSEHLVSVDDLYEQKALLLSYQH